MRTSLLSSLFCILGLVCACRPIQDPRLSGALLNQSFNPIAAQTRMPLVQRAAGVLETDAVQSPFLLLFPELETAPAPFWLRPGTRVTYRFVYATFGRVPDDVTPSGTGLLQYDVIAQDRRNVVATATAINTQIQGQPPTPLLYQVARTGIGEFWFAPEVLETATAQNFEGFSAARLLIEVEDVTYDVIRMQSTTDAGEEVWAFEANSGLLVFYRQALYGNDGEQRSGSILTLLDERRVWLPWRVGSVPDWVQVGTELTYTGNQMLDLGGPPYVPLSLTTTVQFTRVAPRWSAFRQVTTANGREIGRTTGATGTIQVFGGHWLPPEALAVLEAGDILDRDPLSQITTSVEQVTNRQIVIVAAGPDHLTRLTYRPTDGRLIGFYQEAHMQAGTLYTELAAAP